MRIAFFADSYKPYISGVTISIETLSNELRALNHHVNIFAPSYPNHIDSDPDVLRFGSIPTFYPRFRLSFPFLFRYPNVDIVHTHSPFQTGLLAKHLAKKKDKPFVFTFHTLFTRYMHYVRFFPDNISRFLFVSYLKNFCRGVDLIIAPSTLAKRTLRRWGIHNRCEVVPTGIEILEDRDPKQQKLTMRKKLGIPENAKVLVYLGRISTEKNIAFLIDAFKKLYARDTFLLLIGGGPELVDLRLSNLPNVILAGELPHAFAMEYCRAGDIFVFASTSETQGLVLAEAKAIGLPIVALFAGGLVETIRNGIDGYLVQRNLDIFVSHIKKLLNDNELREKMGEEARKDAINRFSSCNVAKRIETLYNQLIK